MKHYNQGNVWGKVLEAKQEKSKKGTLYLSLKIDCTHPEYGPVKAYGRLWGKEKIESLLAARKENKEAVYRFRGIYGQYESEGKKNSSYTFFNWMPADGKPPRASFILVGEVEKKDFYEGYARLFLEVIRNLDDEMDIEDHIEVFLFDSEPYSEIEVGDVVEVKGLIRIAEDFYGGSGDGMRPYVMETKKRKTG